MAQGVYNCYFFEKNLQGDIVAIYNASGTKIATYTYDAWGKVTCTTTSNATTLEKNIATKYNPFRYRGYFYDVETGWYYLQSRYYDPAWGRFISSDDIAVMTATPMGLIDKNLYAYCDNNPVSRIDNGGQFWDTVFDIVSLAVSVVDVINNPEDPMAWVGLAADVVSLAIPGVTGGGMVVDAITKTDDVVDVAKAVTKTDDVVDAAKTIYKQADSSSPIRTATGSYKILYKSGNNYIGKGGFNRAINSAIRNANKYGDEVISITWKSAPNNKAAFIDEYLMQKEFGGVLSSNPNLRTYNKIWSPGKKYYGD